MKAANIQILGYEIRTVDSIQFDVFDQNNINVATGTLNPEHFNDPDIAMDWEWAPHIDESVLTNANKAVIKLLTQS